MSTFNRGSLAVALVLTVGLAACAEEVDDPIAAEPGPQSFTPVEYTHSADTPPTTEDRFAKRMSIPSISTEVLQKPDLPQPSR